MRVSGIVDESIVDGPGLRYVVFTQGCPHHCKGCHNPQTHSFEGGFMLSTEAALAQLQENPQRFSELARSCSACPSKEQGGALGQLSKGQTVPEFEKQLFRQPQGLVTQPLESRYGFHVVYVDQRIEGVQLPYATVAQDIRRELYQRVWQKAVAQYIQTLVGAADIQGIQLEGADSPLVQ